ncbi:MAG: pre-peptidase C-terminal domain-containing protein, partial [Gemmataceae bacterium]|nr:pre-peptidase C-terminal domain-containing protein [Gemmataceae bacterium]
MWIPSFHDLWNLSSPRRRPSPSTRRQAKTRLLVEALEDRCLLAASITGAVFEDLTGNGVSADDLAIAGRVVSLFRDNGDGTFDSSDALAASQPTNSAGRYHFPSLAADTYFVRQDLPLGWAQTGPEDHHDDVTITPAEAGTAPRERNDTIATAVATGLSSANPGTYIARGVIGDKNKELDVDMFQFQLNAGDAVHIDIDAVAFASTLNSVLRLFDATGLQVASSLDTPGDNDDSHIEFVARTTGTYYAGVSSMANGVYNPFVEGSGALAFSTGEYTIEIEVGSRPGAEPVLVQLAANENRTGVDLASARLGSITGQMYEDIDGDGVQDPSEPGMNGQLVVLSHDGVLFSFTFTRSIDLNQDGTINPATESGWYSFEDLRPGIYFAQPGAVFGLGPAGFVQTSPSFEPPQHELIGHVSSGPGSDPGIPGLLPDLTVHLETGLADWFIIGTVLHFGQATPNIGLGPMELRAGADLGGGVQEVIQRIYQNTSETTFIDRVAGTFTFHPEHNHIHFDDYADFKLFAVLPDADGDGIPEVGGQVAAAQKRSFCLVDVAPFDLTLPNADPDGSGLGCNDVQRISVGWEDIYGPLTTGQTMDVSGLAPGQYWLEAVVDPSNRLVESNENNNVGRVLITIDPSQPSAPVGTHGVQLLSGQTAADRDVGNFRLITISGQVFEDKNANGQRDNSEQGLSNQTVFIDLNGDGILNNPEGDDIASALATEPWTITDKHGNYTFLGVGPGTHLIRVVPQDGWVQTTPNPEPIEARSGQSTSGVNFGFLDTLAKKADLG